MWSDLTEAWRSPRLLLASLLLAALSYTGLKPFYARFLVVDRAPWAELLEAFPDRKYPGYAELVRRSAEAIPPGSSVAVIFPTLEWHAGYSYAYFRAQYFLPGRTVIPLGWPSGPQPERLSGAEWVIGFRTSRPAGEWTLVAESGDGWLLRRAR